MTAKKEEAKEVVVRNEIAMDHTTFYVDGFHMIFAVGGAFKLQGFSDHIERPFEQRYVNGVQEAGTNTKSLVTRLEQFEIVITPNLAVQLYNLIGDQLRKLDIPTEAVPKAQQEEKRVESIDLNYR